MSREWSTMQADCLRKISEKTTNMSEYSSLRLVCADWALAIPGIPRHRVTILPQLMLVGKPSADGMNHNQDLYCCRVVNVVDEHNHCMSKIISGVNPHRRVCGSSYGWLILVDQDSEILCLNPLTEKTVNLPPLFSFPNVVFSVNGGSYTITNSFGNTVDLNRRQMRDTFIKKVILSCSPENGAEYIALAIVQCGCQLAYCKKGETKWSFIPEAARCTEDVIFWKGFLYGLSIEKLARCDLTGTKPIVELMGAIIPPIGYNYDLSKRHYLVGLEDRLLLVSRHINEQKVLHMPSTDKCDVFKLVNDNTWLSQETLDGKLLFLGQNSSISVTTCDSIRSTGNVIYFSDDDLMTDYDAPRTHFDTGKFNLRNNTVQPLLLGCENTVSLTCCIWFTPNPWQL